MAFSMAGGGSSGPQINVTPLIDVLLTLIIMFMLVVSMDPEYVEKTQIPQPDQKQPAQELDGRTVVIEIVWIAKDQNANDSHQPARCSLGGSGDAAFANLPDPRRKSGIRSRRRRGSLSVCRERDRSCTPRRREAGGIVDEWTDAGG